MDALVWGVLAIRKDMGAKILAVDGAAIDDY